MFEQPATAWTPVTAWTSATAGSPSTAKMSCNSKDVGVVENVVLKIIIFLGSGGATYEYPVGHLKVVGLCPTCAHIFLYCHKIPVTRKT